uniref:Uncharacterized protein n=1 Tax=Arcella intermedia TaxID=1963864 RepID=A0A6B2L8W7_9EUKA|eukprot:TRINITY_DN4132_c0_g1_i2.p1 TRINITY_DN4132_c0_g1~~TRINITY_DN4132_c0_g1_i2.p1  ORF type:complete len:361 (-),score=61.02 TRINITY_DN4132_c0_g1_i2:125-1180(-)
MGACLKRQGNEKEKRNAMVIDEQLRKYRKELDKEIKLLLLGAGDSGKSTIFKQMKVIHLEGFTIEERKNFRLAVIGNLINTMQCVIRAASSVKVSLEYTNEKASENILHLSGLNDLTGDIRQDIVKVASDKSLKKVLRQTEIQLPDAAPHFIKHAERIMSEDFIPTVDDILRTRIKTMGISEISFKIEGNNFKLVDVGGQRSERRKWISCFDNVTAIIFCLALSEYNLVLEEDRTVNRMHESLQLFKEICNSEWFRKVALILFLNKSDIFQEKITKVNLDVCFPDYKGQPDFDEATDFITKKFMQLDKTGRKKIYPHVTIATNTENIRFVFEAVRDIIVQAAIATNQNYHM